MLGGLQQHLKAPHLLKAFAKSYEEERRKLASEKLSLRDWAYSEADDHSSQHAAGAYIGGALPNRRPLAVTRLFCSCANRLRRIDTWLAYSKSIDLPGDAARSAASTRCRGAPRVSFQFIL